MRIIQFFLVAALASLGCTGTQPLAQGVEITFEQRGLWYGTWMTAGSSIENNVYHMLSITDANVRSFTYVLENRSVPYGPNSLWSEGTAQFRNALEAVDSEAGRTFVLRDDSWYRQQRVIEIDGVRFLFDGPGVGVPSVDLPAPPATETAVTTRIEDDHGDTEQLATPIGSDSSTPGTITSGDVDYFRIDLREAATLQIWTSGDMDTVGELEAGDGSMIATNDDSGLYLNFEMNENVRGGTYFIRVAAYSDTEAGNYTLHVRPLHVRPTPVRAPEVPPLNRDDGGWDAQHVNEDGQLELWLLDFNEGRGAVSGTFEVLVRNAEDLALLADSVRTTVTGTYNHPVVVLSWTIEFTEVHEETAECMFGGVMESNGGAIIGGLVCGANGYSIDRQLRFLHSVG